ncbi:MAG TPA: sodium:solute symporter family protein [Pyrinomonadaceae bacterium]|nr:sodium:solute symporter family protein [Pyrinomonadaceae bacterium]
MTEGLHTADYLIIAGYFLLLTLIGLYFWRKMKHVRDFFTGGNAIPWWLAGVSFYLTGFSAFTFVAYSEMAYRFGFVSVTLAWSSAAAMVIGTIFLAGRWRRAGLISPVEFLEERYSGPIRQVIAWLGIPLKVIDDGLKIYATGVFVSVGLGFDLKMSIILSGVVMLAYTFMGGLWAVVVTDFVQFIILTLGVIVLFPIVFSQFDSFGSFLASTPPGFNAPVSEPFSLIYVFAFYLLITLSYNGNWAFAQKFYSTRDERDARKAGMLAVALKIIGPPLFILPAMAARTLLPELMTPPNSPQYTYAALSLKFLPVGLMGLMVAAMFSATMSTLSGDYNVMASVITEDIYRRLFDKNATQKRLVIVGRAATLLIGVLTVLIGISLIASAKKGLFEVMVTVFGLFVGPMLIPMLAGLLVRKVTWRGAAAGIATGFVSGLSFYLYKSLVLSSQPGIDPNWLRYDYEAISILTNFAVTIGAMAITTFLEKPSAEEKARIDAFFLKLSTPVNTAKTHAKVTGEVFSPFKIISWVTAGTGAMLLIAGFTQPTGIGQYINCGSAAALFILATFLYQLHRRFMRRAEDDRADKFSTEPVIATK